MTTAHKAIEFLTLLPRRLGMLMVFTYQVAVRPFLAGTCRYCPSCSEYAIESLRLWGLARGARLTLSRLARCHPFAGGGYDPVVRPDQVGHHELNRSTTEGRRIDVR